ncbi:hypothetical protein STENM223S_09207 [Streptomyces tendae]
MVGLGVFVVRGQQSVCGRPCLGSSYELQRFLLLLLEHGRCRLRLLKMIQQRSGIKAWVVLQMASKEPAITLREAASAEH